MVFAVLGVLAEGVNADGVTYLVGSFSIRCKSVNIEVNLGLVSGSN